MKSYLIQHPKTLVFTASVFSILATSVQAVPGWGYNYGQLVHDLDIWRKSPSVQIDSIGASVQNRAIWHLRISDPSAIPQFRIVIHARTHPLEVQGWRVAEQIIALLTDSAQYSSLLNQYTFDIIPMLNPDGVELDQSNPCSPGPGRCNANGIDLEREWAKSPPQPEVASLKNLYTARITDHSIPLKVMLNLHSAFGCERYFWAHDSNGTSPFYWAEQRRFIELVRENSDSEILAHDTKVSWQSGNPGIFPESWFWSQSKEKIMALTFEDRKECNDGKPDLYNETAKGLLRGIHAFLQNQMESRPNPQTNKPNWKKALWYNSKGILIHSQDYSESPILQRPMYQGLLIELLLDASGAAVGRVTVRPGGL